MPAFMYTMVFRYTSGTSTESTGQRSGSWSEKYVQGTYTTQRLNAFKDLCELRAVCLCRGASIIAIRVQQIDPAGPAASFPVNYPAPIAGGLANDRDIPQMALKFRFNGSAVSNVTKYAFPCIPDPQVTGGEYNPTPGYRVLFRNFLSGLSNWQFRGTDLTQTYRDVATITALGVVTVTSDLALAVNDLVNFRRVVTADGDEVGGVYAVDAATTLRQFTLRRWNNGACTGGRVRKHIVIYPNFSNAQDAVPKIGVRKIGRPSDPYRGRRSKRRR